MNGCNNSATKRDQMRRELDDHFFSGRVCDLLFNLRQMPVRGQTIGPSALVALDKKQIRVCFPASATHTAETVHNDTRRADQVCAYDRKQWYENARRKTTWTRQQLSAPDLIAICFRKPVNRFLQ